jgi:hypothetical protein
MGRPMAKSAITFHELRQDSQQYGSDDEHMVSRVFFGMVINGKDYHGLSVDLKQTVGSTAADPIEVGRPIGYTGPLNYQDFRAGVEAYFRSLVGKAGTGIQIGGGGSVRMTDNVFQKTLVFEFDVDDKAHAAW